MALRSSFRAGFTRPEILVVALVLAVLAGAILLKVGGSGRSALEVTLKANAADLRQALNMYRVEHGWYPCDSRDGNAAGDAALFVRQLTRYTNAAGEVSETRDSEYRYGPYLESFPAEPITGLGVVVINLRDRRTMEALASAVAASAASGGWYYEARSGNIVANLGNAFPNAYASY